MTHFTEPLNYSDLYDFLDSWEDLDFIRNLTENSETERILADQRLSWDWSPAARKALTKFRRIEGLFLPVEELREALEKEWGAASEHILSFQRELAGVYFETRGKGRVVLGISQVTPRLEFIQGEMPNEEFFFSNYEDWGCKDFLRHDGKVVTGRTILYRDAKSCLENVVAQSELKIHGLPIFSVFISLNSGTLSGSTEEGIFNILPSLGYKEKQECNDGLNRLYTSPNGNARKSLARLEISFTSTVEEEAEAFYEHAKSIGFVLKSITESEEAKLWILGNKER